MFAFFSASCLIRRSWRSRTQPNRLQNRMDSGTRLSVIAVRVLLSRTHAHVSEVLPCGLYAYCIDYNCAEGVLQAMGVSKVLRDASLYTILLEEQEERLPGDMTLPVAALPSGDPSGEQITIGARTNIVTQ